MKLKFLFLVVCFAVLLNSCKKGDDKLVEPTSSISFKVDGLEKIISPCKAVMGVDTIYVNSAGFTSSYTIPSLHINSELDNEAFIIHVAYPSVKDSFSQDQYSVIYIIGQDTYKSLLNIGGTDPKVFTIKTLTTNYVTGAFKFSAAFGNKVKVITDGVFGCKISKS